MAVIKNGLWVFVVAAILLSATYWNPFASRDEASNAGGTPNSQGWDARRYQGARVEAAAAVEEDRWDDVVELCSGMLVWREDDEVVWLWLGLGYLIQGQYEQSEEIWNYALRFSRNRRLSLYNLACCQGLQGKKEAAIGTFRQLLDEGYTDYDHVDEDQHFFPLRGEPGFESMLDELARRAPFEF